MNTYTNETFQKFSKRSKHTALDKASEHEQDNKRYSKQSYKQQREVKRCWEGE